jgi:serine/threonine protein kinase
LDSIAHYKILERVGESRLGEVFRARDTRLGRTVAIKVLPDSIQKDQAKRDALLADARAAMALSHPNIALLYEAGDENGRAFLACEFVPGDALDRVIAGHALNARRAIDLTVQIADALADGHAAEMAHGNLTAAAVVVTPKGSAKILDFGLARWTRADGRAGDEAADIRALGTLFYEMLTGKAPLASANAPPTSLNKSLPSEVDEIAAKALSTAPDRAYQAAVTFAAELRSVAAVLEVRAEAADKTRPAPVRGAARRSKAPWIAVAFVAAAAAIAAAWWWMR